MILLLEVNHDRIEVGFYSLVRFLDNDVFEKEQRGAVFCASMTNRFRN